MCARLRSRGVFVPKKKWSKTVTEHSDALDLEDKVFIREDPLGNRGFAETFGRA
ncbi:MAG: DUF3175 domain-containing protein [Sphingomonadaceae bacterium]